MCDFHSICVRRDGAIAHIQANSHSGAIEAAGWQENTDSKRVFVECEWDGDGEYSLERVVSLRGGLTIDELTNKQVKSIARHYKALAKALGGDISIILPGGVLHGEQYWDVYLRCYHSGSVSGADKDKILRELLTVVAGAGGTATAGYGGTAKAGDEGTATAGDEGTATAGWRGTATAGDEGTAKAGDEGTATAGDEGTAKAGWRGTATAGWRGTATAGDEGTAKAGDEGTATAGYGGCISILWYNGKRYLCVVGAVDGKKIKPNTPYKVVDGKFVKVEESK